MLQMPLIHLTQMCKIRMQMWCKVLQIRLRVLEFKTQLRVPQIKIRLKVLQFKFQFKVPAVQIPVQGPTQIGQNIPVQPLQQLVPLQPVPAGILVSTPQIIYQNWIGKKPDFSGKPEEDAESHLLSARD